MGDLLDKLRRRAAAWSRNKDKARITIRLGDVREAITHIEALEATLYDVHKLLERMPVEDAAPILQKINAALAPAPAPESVRRTDPASPAHPISSLAIGKS